MVSPRALEDLETLREEGLQPSIEDIVRLNALGLLLDSSQETTFANAPRIGWAGTVAIHQPTCQVEMWMMDVGEVIAEDERTKDSLWCFACAHARTPDFFVDLYDIKKVRDAVKSWFRTVTCTREELSRAFWYAVCGDDSGGDVYPDETELKKLHPDIRSFRASNFQKLDEEMREAREKLHLTTAEMMTMTRSRIIEMLYLNAICGGVEVKRNTAKALVDYLTTLRATRKRLEEERDKKCPKAP